MPEDFKSFALNLSREILRAKLEAFGKTPEGKVVREGGRRIMVAQREGRDLSPNDIAEFFNDIPAIMGDNEK